MDGSTNRESVITKVRALVNAGVGFEFIGRVLAARTGEGLYCIPLDKYPEETINEIIDLVLPVLK